MPLIRDGEIVENSWVTLGGEETIPRDGDVILPLERYRAELDAVKARKGRTGVALDNAVDPDDIAGLLPGIDLVVLHFPAFTDGRAYSQAHQLRTHLGYEGEIRATGVVLADQAAFLARVGFDSFDTESAQPLEVWNRAARAMSVAYQRGYGGPQATRRF